MSELHYLDTIGLTTLWSKIKSLFATKTELSNGLNSKANDSDVVHKSGEETIANKKTFTDGIYGKYIEFSQNSGEAHGGFIDFHYAGSTDDYTSRIIENGNGILNINGCEFKDGVMSGTATDATNATNAVNCPNYLPLSGGNLTSNFVGRNVDNDFLHLSGCTDYIKGAMLIMYGENYTEWVGGGFRLIARNSSTIHELDGYPNGTLSWSGTEFYANTLKGNLAIFYKFGNNDLYRDVDNGYLALGGGSKYDNGSTFILGGVSNTSYAGQAIIRVKDSSNSYELKARCTDSGISKNGALSWTGTVIYGSDNTCDLGNSAKRFKDIYATNATINTSDRNAKQDISVIEDKLLDAWGNINPVTFRLISSVEQKGDNARVHTGYIAQDVKEELDKYGIDACKYGLFCYNSWDAQEERSHEEERTDEEGNTEIVKVIDIPAREAGETYGLRYIECLVVECAYLRKKNKELEDRITKLEENLHA